MNFDLARRHSLRRAVRLAEAHALLDGDQGWLKHARGDRRGRVELIEGDLVRHQEQEVPDAQRDQWVNGVRVDARTGQAVAYAIANRSRHGYTRGRVVRQRDLIVRGYYTRYDQVRGVSPMACALNTLREVDESFDYARAKVKLSQLMGMMFTRSADGPLGEYTANDLRDHGEADPESDDAPRYDVDLSDGVFSVDLDRGDKAEIIESRTPASETTGFLKLMAHVAMRSVDIPYSFFDESFTNFYGQRGSFLSYLQACQPKREDNQEMLAAWTRWRSGLMVAGGELTLPRGKDFSFLRFEWVPISQPWWDPNKEITAQLSAIAAGLTTPQRVCQEYTNSDFEQNIDAIAKALEYAREKNVVLSFDAQAAQRAALQEIAEEAENEEAARRGEEDADDAN